MLQLFSSAFTRWLRGRTIQAEPSGSVSGFISEFARLTYTDFWVAEERQVERYGCWAYFVFGCL